MFRERLQEIRNDHHDTQLQLSKKLGVAKSSVSNWEQGKSEPGFDILCKICQIYDVSSDFLLGLSDEDPMLKGPLNKENTEMLRKFEAFLLSEQQKKNKK